MSGYFNSTRHPLSTSTISAQNRRKAQSKEDLIHCIEENYYARKNELPLQPSQGSIPSRTGVPALFQVAHIATEAGAVQPPLSCSYPTCVLGQVKSIVILPEIGLALVQVRLRA
jgi:hypothetical protein